MTLVDSHTFGTDYMTWVEVRSREGWINPCAMMDPATHTRKVSELLVELVESADFLVINKVDTATSEELETATAVTKAIIEKAQMMQVQFAKIDPEIVIGDGTNNTIEYGTTVENDDHCTDHRGHTHDYGHHDDSISSPCTDTTCTDHSHNHHHHDASHDGGNHDHHDHDCSDPTSCTDPTHDHHHDHDDGNESSLVTNDHGILSFVYRAAVPFDVHRIINVLNRRTSPTKETLDMNCIQKREFDVDGTENNDGDGDDENNIFAGVLRSKGFCCFAPTNLMSSSTSARAGADPWRHDTAVHWSRAGKHFSITAAGKWWATLPEGRMKLREIARSTRRFCATSSLRRNSGIGGRSSFSSESDSANAPSEPSSTDVC